MSVRRETRRRQDGTERVLYMIDIKLQHPNGDVIRVRKVSPIATLRGARAYERELREALLERREPPGEGASMSVPTPAEEVHHDPPRPTPKTAPRHRPASTSRMTPAI